MTPSDDVLAERDETTLRYIAELESERDRLRARVERLERSLRHRFIRKPAHPEMCFECGLERDDPVHGRQSR